MSRVGLRLAGRLRAAAGAGGARGLRRSQGRAAPPGSVSTDIRKGTQNLDAAYAFLDGKLAEETSRNVVETFYYGASNQDVLDSTTDPELIEILSLDDPTVLDRTRFSRT